MNAADSTLRTPGQILMESTVGGSKWSYQSDETREMWERHAVMVCGSIAEELRRAFIERDKLWAAVHRLRDLRDALVDSMERQGGIPMTDALADALVAAGVDIHGKREVEPDMVTVPKELLARALQALRCCYPYIGNGLNHTEKRASAIKELDAALRATAPTKQGGKA